MDEKAIFLTKTEDGKLVKTDNLTEADYVRVPANQYISPTAWNNLADKYTVLLRQSKSKISSEDTVVIKKGEYNGFMNMLRIIRDRSLQSIEKAKADSHGYTFKYADMRPYERDNPQKTAYHITKITPVSLKVDLETAYFMIIRDLTEYYNYVTPLYKPSPEAASIKIQIPDIITGLAQRDDPEYKLDFYVTNSEYGESIKRFLDDRPKVLSFGPVKIGSNLGQGVYEVSYWASNPI